MDNARKMAFPLYAEGEISEGLNKREYLAGLAMQGLLSGWPPEDAAPSHKVIAANAVHYADALLAELDDSQQ